MDFIIPIFGLCLVYLFLYKIGGDLEKYDLISLILKSFSVLGLFLMGFLFIYVSHNPSTNTILSNNSTNAMQVLENSTCISNSTAVNTTICTYGYNTTAVNWLGSSVDSPNFNQDNLIVGLGLLQYALEFIGGITALFTFIALFLRMKKDKGKDWWEK